MTDRSRTRENAEEHRGRKRERAERAVVHAGGCTVRARGGGGGGRQGGARERRVSREGKEESPAVYPVFEPKVQGCVQVNKLTRRRCECDFLSYQPQSAPHSLSSPPPASRSFSSAPPRVRFSFPSGRSAPLRSFVSTIDVSYSFLISPPFLFVRSLSLSLFPWSGRPRASVAVSSG